MASEPSAGLPCTYVHDFGCAPQYRTLTAVAMLAVALGAAACGGDDGPSQVATGGVLGTGGTSGAAGSGGTPTFAGRPGEVTFINCTPPSTVHTLGATVSSSTPRVALAADPTRDDMIDAAWLADDGSETVRLSRFAVDDTLVDEIALTNSALSRRSVDLVRKGHQLALGYIANDDAPFQIFTRMRDDSLTWTPSTGISDTAAPAQNVRLAHLSAATGYAAVWTTKVDSNSPLQLMVGRVGADGKFAATPANVTTAKQLINFGLGTSPMGQELGAPIVYTTQDDSGTTATLWLRDIDKDGNVGSESYPIAESRSFIGEPIAVRVLPSEALVAWTESLLSGTEYLVRVHLRRLRFATNGPDYGSERILTLGYLQSRTPTFAALPGVIALVYETIDEQGARAITIRMITRDGDIGTEPSSVYAVPADAELGPFAVRESYDFQAFAVAWSEAATSGAQRFAKLALARCVE